MNTPTTPLPHTSGFDTRLQGCHQAALQQISPQVRAQLAQRRNAALRGVSSNAQRSHSRFRFAAAGVAALCALAIGLRFYPSDAPLPSPPIAASTATVSGTNASGNTLLEEDPDFYAWLGTSGAQQLALE